VLFYNYFFRILKLSRTLPTSMHSTQHNWLTPCGFICDLWPYNGLYKGRESHFLSPFKRENTQTKYRMTVLSARPYVLILCNLFHKYMETPIETNLGTSLFGTHLSIQLNMLLWVRQQASYTLTCAATFHNLGPRTVGGIQLVKLPSHLWRYKLANL
jgi:hypothetical protein